MNVKIFDSTLRDGSHAVKQQLKKDDIVSYCRAIDGSGVYTTIVGHGNGIGASSIQMGKCAIDEIEMLENASNNLVSTKLGTFVTVGFGTVQNQIIPAIEMGTEVFCIAAHCTEADTLRKHIEYLATNNHETYGVLMNIHMANPDKLLEQARLIESYGANGIILMDSAGCSLPENIKAVISTLKDGTNFEIGLHPHNNLGIAVANAYEAIKNGATIIDGTIGGFGAGAGNCQIDALVALLEKEGIDSGCQLFQMLNVSQNIIQEKIGYNKLIDATCVVSGYAGVVSTFKTRVEEVAKKYNVSPLEIFIELGKKQAIAGQDDLILEVAQKLKGGY